MAKKTATQESEPNYEAALETVVERVAKRLATAHGDGVEKAEGIIRNAIEEGRELYATERLEAMKLAGWDDRELQRQIGRVSRVAKSQMIVGTSDDRAAFKKQCKEDQERLDTEGPELESRIETATRQLNALRDKVRQNEKRAEQIEVHKSLLADMLPEHVEAELSAITKAVNSSLRRHLLDVQTELNGLRMATDPSKHSNETSFIECVRSQFPEHVSYGNTHNRDGLSYGRYALKPSWGEKLPKLRERMLELEKDEAELQSEWESEMQSLDRFRQMYWR